MVYFSPTSGKLSPGSVHSRLDLLLIPRPIHGVQVPHSGSRLLDAGNIATDDRLVTERRAWYWDSPTCWFFECFFTSPEYPLHLLSCILQHYPLLPVCGRRTPLYIKQTPKSLFLQFDQQLLWVLVSASVWFEERKLTHWVAVREQSKEGNSQIYIKIASCYSRNDFFCFTFYFILSFTFKGGEVVWAQGRWTGRQFLPQTAEIGSKVQTLGMNSASSLISYITTNKLTICLSLNFLISKMRF